MPNIASKSVDEKLRAMRLVIVFGFGEKGPTFHVKRFVRFLTIAFAKCQTSRSMVPFHLIDLIQNPVSPIITLPLLFFGYMLGRQS